MQMGLRSQWLFNFRENKHIPWRAIRRCSLWSHESSVKAAEISTVSYEYQSVNGKGRTLSQFQGNLLYICIEALNYMRGIISDTVEMVYSQYKY